MTREEFDRADRAASQLFATANVWRPIVWAAAVLLVAAVLWLILSAVA